MSPMRPADYVLYAICSLIGCVAIAVVIWEFIKDRI